MNRAERRRLSSNDLKVSKIYTLRAEDIDAIRKEERDKAVSTALSMMLGIPLMVLHEKFGFGAVRIERFIDEVKLLYCGFESGYLTLDDMKNTIYEELQIKVDM